jgi:hypothetical protein
MSTAPRCSWNPTTGDVLDDACLALVFGKTNVLLWGDSLAAHYFHDLSQTIDLQAVHVLQATQAHACRH